MYKLQQNKVNHYDYHRRFVLGISLIRTTHGKYSVLPHITDKHMRFSPPPANSSGGYTLI